MLPVLHLTQCLDRPAQALKPELTRLAKQVRPDLALLERRHEDAVRPARQEPREVRLANRQRQPAQIVAVERQDVEGRRRRRPAPVRPAAYPAPSLRSLRPGARMGARPSSTSSRPRSGLPKQGLSYGRPTCGHSTDSYVGDCEPNLRIFGGICAPGRSCPGPDDLIKFIRW